MSEKEVLPEFVTQEMILWTQDMGQIHEEVDAQVTGQSKETTAPPEARENIDGAIQSLKAKTNYPPEFYPAQGFSSENMFKIPPMPFYELGKDEIIMFDNMGKNYRTTNLGKACSYVEDEHKISNQRRGSNDSLAAKVVKKLVRHSPKLSYYGLVAGYQGGAYKTCGGNLIVVPETVPILEAAETAKLKKPKEAELNKTSWRLSPSHSVVLESEANIEMLPYFEHWQCIWDECFKPLLVSPGGNYVQVKILFQLWAGARAVIGKGCDRKIPALAIVGAANTGKTFLADIYNRILNARTVNPRSYLYGEAPWNSDLVGAPLWVVDDLDLREGKTADRFKEIIVGSGLQIEQKYNPNTPMVYPKIAIVIAANDDIRSRRTIPTITSSTKDKIILFKAYEAGIPAGDRNERKERFWKALPYFAAFLDEYMWPYMQQSERMVAPAWQNPEIMKKIFDDTEDGQAHSDFQTFLRHNPQESGKEHTAEEWIELMEKCSEICRNAGRYYETPRKFGWIIRDLAEKYPDLYERRRKSGGQRERLIKMSLEKEEEL